MRAGRFYRPVYGGMMRSRHLQGFLRGVHRAVVVRPHTACADEPNLQLLSHYDSPVVGAWHDLRRSYVKNRSMVAAARPYVKRGSTGRAVLWLDNLR